ncbi:GAST1 protein homolog 1 [Prunus dulcis]|uniref:GAST1 protein homolog 1 n=1 Tax=Prunus dulcis TaxID=3755 RepID=A0A4Y1QSH8_PRUDU|nr:GAST1 protein homolog 1 [Prunus dulcis]
MAISVSISSRIVILVSVLVVCLVVFNPVDADETTVVERALLDVVCLQGLGCARGHAGLAASAAAVFLRVLPGIRRSAPATPPSPPTAANASVLEFQLQTSTNLHLPVVFSSELR